MKLKEIIFESIMLFEDEKHVRQLFTSWANKKSGNPELALSLIDDFFKYKKIIKRDFSSFSSAEEMAQVIEKVKISQQEKLKSSDVDKIYEDEKVLIIAAKTHEASCKYAAGTKWCTGAADTDQYWKRHNRTGTEFIWIVKGLKEDNPNYKFSLHFKWVKNIKITQSLSQKFDSDWCNAQNRCSSRIPNTLLTILGEDSFDNIFDKCMNYHEKRNDEKPLDQISDLKNQFIRKVKEIFNRNKYDTFHEVLSDIDFNYQLNNTISNNGGEPLSEDELEYEHNYFYESMTKLEDEIINSVDIELDEDLLNVDDEEINDDLHFSIQNYGISEDEFIEEQAYSYIRDQIEELFYEDITVKMDEYINNWIENRS